MTIPLGAIPVPSFVVMVGRKGSGKSHLAESLWLSYPHDRLCIDSTGTVAQDLGSKKSGRDEHRVIRGGPAPARWPRRDDEPRSSIIYVPDRRELDWLTHADSWIGLAYDHHRTSVWVDEFGRIARHGICPPHYANGLETGRHVDLSLIQCAPRAVGADGLVIAQADLIYIFDLPQHSDRVRIAEVSGFSVDTIDAGVEDLGPFEHLRLDTTAPSGSRERLMHMGPLPR